MAPKVLIVFHSMYGHMYKLALALEEGAKAAGAEVTLRQVREILPTEVLEKMFAVEAKKAFEHVPIVTVEELADADAIILGSGTRFGSVSASMQSFLDSTGVLWRSGALVGKIGSAFTGSAGQHGGQETTLLHMHTYFLHQGMLVSGCPYAAKELLELNDVSGGTPYGATTISGPTGQRQPTANELAIARYQGKHVATMAGKMSG